MGLLGSSKKDSEHTSSTNPATGAQSGHVASSQSYHPESGTTAAGTGLGDTTGYNAQQPGSYGSSQPQTGAYTNTQPQTGSYGSSTQPQTGAYGSTQPQTGSYGSAQPQTGAYGSTQPNTTTSSSYGTSQPQTGSYGSQVPVASSHTYGTETAPGYGSTAENSTTTSSGANYPNQSGTATGAAANSEYANKHPIEQQAIKDAKTHGNKEQHKEDMNLAEKIKDKLHIGSKKDKGEYETPKSSIGTKTDTTSGSYQAPRPIGTSADYPAGTTHGVTGTTAGSTGTHGSSKHNDTLATGVGMGAAAGAATGSSYPAGTTGSSYPAGTTGSSYPAGTTGSSYTTGTTGTTGTHDHHDHHHHHGQTPGSYNAPTATTGSSYPAGTTSGLTGQHPSTHSEHHHHHGAVPAATGAGVGAVAGAAGSNYAHNPNYNAGDTSEYLSAEQQKQVRQHYEQANQNRAPGQEKIEGVLVVPIPASEMQDAMQTPRSQLSEKFLKENPGATNTTTSTQGTNPAYAGQTSTYK